MKVRKKEDGSGNAYFDLGFKLTACRFVPRLFPPPYSNFLNMKNMIGTSSQDLSSISQFRESILDKGWGWVGEGVGRLKWKIEMERKMGYDPRKYFVHREILPQALFSDIFSP
uniref:Uncharacterized protein n=1 Tax=Vespula pensylvanica TaxID=30213 RepID=A0A834NRM8_VESPE|nr:hypothetical protein H0235_011221 [Vespula pensylvanica]